MRDFRVLRVLRSEKNKCRTHNVFPLVQILLLSLLGWSSIGLLIFRNNTFLVNSISIEVIIIEMINQIAVLPSSWAHIEKYLTDEFGGEQLRISKTGHLQIQNIHYVNGKHTLQT